MQSILEAFANDNITPNSRFFLQNSAYGKAVAKVADTEEKLMAVLDEEPKILLADFSDAQSALNLISNTDKFIYGYRLGVLMTTEVFNVRDDLVVGGEGKA